jgi:hypothetical protein
LFFYVGTLQQSLKKKKNAQARKREKARKGKVEAAAGVKDNVASVFVCLHICIFFRAIARDTSAPAYVSVIPLEPHLFFDFPFWKPHNTKFWQLFCSMRERKQDAFAHL